MNVLNKILKNEINLVTFLMQLKIFFIKTLIITVFRVLNQDSIIDTIYTIAGYTYGPLLGLYAFGLFTKFNIKDKLVFLAAILPPIITGIIDFNAESWFGFKLGYEKLVLNGALTFLILFVIRRKKV